MPEEVTTELHRLRERIAELERRNAELGSRLSHAAPRATGSSLPVPPYERGDMPGAAAPLFFRVNWQLHKWAGLITIVFLLVMGVSGIFLTHANILGLQPIMLRLHTGIVLGPFARLYCDVAGVSLIVLVVSGIVLYLYPGPVKPNAAP